MVSEEASIVEEKQREYELVVIISPKVENESLDTLVDNVSRLITDKGGVISQMEQWGKRKLAYPIKHFLEGNYILYQFKMEPTFNKALEANLEITEGILRYLLINLDS